MVFTPRNFFLSNFENLFILKTCILQFWSIGCLNRNLVKNILQKFTKNTLNIKSLIVALFLSKNSNASLFVNYKSFSSKN